MNRAALLVTILPVCGISLLIYESWNLPWTPQRIAGLVILVPALFLLVIARFQLGNSFSLTPQARKLVTHGLYAKFRNPVYVFGFFVIGGLILFLNRPVFLLAFLFLIPMQIARARAEAQVLEEKFGDEYRRYRAQTWF